MPGKSWGQRLRRGAGDCAPALPPAAPQNTLLSPAATRPAPPSPQTSFPRRMLRGGAPLAALLLAALSLARGEPPAVPGCGMEAPSRRASSPHHPHGLYPHGPAVHGALGAASPRGRRPRGARAGGGGEEPEGRGRSRGERRRGREPQVPDPPRERPLPALYFSGGREQLAARAEALPAVPREEFTLELWVKAEGGQNNPAIIAGKARQGGMGTGHPPTLRKYPHGALLGCPAPAGDTPRPHPCCQHRGRGIFLLPLRPNPEPSPPLCSHPPRPPSPPPFPHPPIPPRLHLVFPSPLAGSWNVPVGDTLPLILLPCPQPTRQCPLLGAPSARSVPGLPGAMAARWQPSRAHRPIPARAAAPSALRNGCGAGGSSRGLFYP